MAGTWYWLVTMSYLDSCGNAWPISVSWASQTMAAGLQEKARESVLKYKMQTSPVPLQGMPGMGTASLLPHLWQVVMGQDNARENKFQFSIKEGLYQTQTLSFFHRTKYFSQTEILTLFLSFLMSVLRLYMADCNSFLLTFLTVIPPKWESLSFWRENVPNKMPISDDQGLLSECILGPPFLRVSTLGKNCILQRSLLSCLRIAGFICTQKTVSQIQDISLLDLAQLFSRWPWVNP